MQLAGHLCSRALQEWELLDVDTKTSYIRAIEALRLRLDPGSRTLAAQDFRHTSQAEDEIRRLERTSMSLMGGKVCQQKLVTLFCMVSYRMG